MHCDALLKRRAAPADLLGDLARAGDGAARALSEALAGIGGDGLPEVRSRGVETLAAGDLAARIGPLACNRLLAVGDGAQLVLSIEARAVLARLDRAFGGTGEIGETLPAALPLSADLLAERMESAIVAALAAALGDAGGWRTAGRDTRLARLAPVAADAAMAVLTIDIAEPGARPWQACLAIRAEDLPALLCGAGRAAAPAPGVASDPLDPPFADLPLRLDATLADMRVPLSRLASLAPGQVLPIAVAREVPLRIGDTVVAKGTIGALDERVALQITHAPVSGKGPQ